MNPMTQMLAQQRINDLHRTASRSRVARQAKAGRTVQALNNRRRARRAQLAAVTA